MAQQTQVARVLERYERWLARWPTAGDLAAATPAEVLTEWVGLGYNQRALRLRAACEIVARDGWPRDSRGLRALPGVGPYTAAAVASFAFGERAAAVDTNVRRVAARLGAGPEALLPRDRHDDWNQAAMELGALVCTARAPRCTGCPAAPWCPSRGRVAACRAGPARAAAALRGDRSLGARPRRRRARRRDATCRRRSRPSGWSACSRGSSATASSSAAVRCRDSRALRARVWLARPSVCEETPGGTLALDRQSIEKRDFPIGRRGYEPEAVDAHLATVAREVEALKRAAERAGGARRGAAVGAIAGQRRQRPGAGDRRGRRGAAPTRSSARPATTPSRRPRTRLATRSARATTPSSAPRSTSARSTRRLR